MKRFKKILKRLIGILIVLAVLSIVGLIVNNRICLLLAKQRDTKRDTLLQTDLERVHNVFNMLENSGNSIFEGFDGTQMSLIIYNEKYEFLFYEFEPDNGTDKEWEYIGKDERSNRNIFRRQAKNPQAFAVKVADKWVGSFPAPDAYNVQLIEQIPICFPPQLLSLDEGDYCAAVIHEMAHAYQGHYNDKRVDEAEHVKHVCSSYYGNSRFNELIEKEASYLKAAINEQDDFKYRENVKNFLNIRQQRRDECGMTDEEIQAECEIEWLEGIARYAEYCISEDLKGKNAAGMTDILSKVRVKGDERYYALGMAQFMIIKKAGVTYEKRIFTENISLEKLIKEIVEA